MANIKSAKKRILVNETKAARNKAIRSKVKTAIKKVEAAVAAGDKAAARHRCHRVHASARASLPAAGGAAAKLAGDPCPAADPGPLLGRHAVCAGGRPEPAEPGLPAGEPDRRIFYPAVLICI